MPIISIVLACISILLSSVSMYLKRKAIAIQRKQKEAEEHKRILNEWFSSLSEDELREYEALFYNETDDRDSESKRRYYEARYQQFISEHIDSERFR